MLPVHSNSSAPFLVRGRGTALVTRRRLSFSRHSSAASTLPMPKCPLGPAGPLCPVLRPASTSIVPGGIQQQLQTFLEASLTEEERARLLEGVIKGPWLWFVRGQESASPGWALQNCKPAAPHGCDSAMVQQETWAIRPSRLTSDMVKGSWGHWAFWACGGRSLVQLSICP